MLVNPPSQYASMDVQRMTLLYFSLFGLDLINDIREPQNDLLSQGNRYGDKQDPNQTLSKEDVIEWIYAQQIIPRDKGEQGGLGGLRGGSFLGIPFNNNERTSVHEKKVYVETWDRINMAATHNGLCALLLLGDDLSRLCHKAVVNTVRTLQNDHGAFASMQNGECDMRFVFCAYVCIVLCIY